MIPDLPQEVSDSARMHFYSTLAGNLADQSSIHVNWHTHRQNPSICWICDLNILISKVLILQGINTKSSLDMETELSSEDVSDSEIESNLNANSIEPEYDTVGDAELPEESE